MEHTERLQRVIAARGAGSRRAAEDAIRAGRVMVDGQLVTDLGVKVDPTAVDIRLDGKLLRPQRLRTIVLNKPSGYITTTSDERGRRTVMDLIDVPERLYPVGRLDRETQGLLLFTNDGDIANRVMHPRYQLDKEYHVLTLSRPNERALQRVRDGVIVEGKKVVPEEIRILRETREGIILKIVVHQGMYHVVRLVMQTVGIPVERLRRTRIGPLTIAGLGVGEWRDLTAGEQHQLSQALHLEREDDEIEQIAAARSRRPKPPKEPPKQRTSGKRPTIGDPDRQRRRRSDRSRPPDPSRPGPPVTPYDSATAPIGAASRQAAGPDSRRSDDRRGRTDDRRPRPGRGRDFERDNRRPGQFVGGRPGPASEERGQSPHPPAHRAGPRSGPTGPGPRPGSSRHFDERDDVRGETRDADQRFQDRRGARPRRPDSRPASPRSDRGQGRVDRAFDAGADIDRGSDELRRDPARVEIEYRRRDEQGGPPAGGRDRRRGGGRQDDRLPAPRRSPRRDAL
jgi:23S rRNA pseudouridine2605 synthase